MAEEAQRRAKLFMNGRSQAVRLPHDMRFGGKEVLVRRFGNGVLLEPLPEVVGEGDSSLAHQEEVGLVPMDDDFAEMVERAMQELEKS